MDKRIDRYVGRVTEIVGLDSAARARPVVLALLGAADRLCADASAGRIDRNTAVDTLVEIFGPVVRPSPAALGL